MSLLLPFLEIGGVSSAPVVPAPDQVSLAFPRSQTSDITLSGKRVVSRAPQPEGAVITIKAGLVATEAFRAAIDAAQVVGSFLLRETLTDRRTLRAWLGCTFSGEPSWSHYAEEGNTVYYSLDNALVVLAGSP